VRSEKVDVRMLYRKNVFKWEQAARIVLGVVLADLPFLTGVEPAFAWVVGGSMLALTGIFGFCPACYAVGRKTPDFRQVEHG
jgi:hypothetical protein